MGWTCITGVLDQSGPFWIYTTIDCDTQQPGVAFFDPGLSEGDCSNPSEPSCWQSTPAALAEGKSKVLRVKSENMSDLDAAMAKMVAQKLAAVDPSIQLEE